MRYRFYHGDVLIGCSELEHADPSMGIRMGRFHPGDGYLVIEPICKVVSMVRFDEHWAQFNPGEAIGLERLRARREQLQKLVDDFHLRLETEEGRTIGTSWIHIED